MSQLSQLRERVAMFKSGENAKATLIAGAGKQFWSLNRKERRFIVKRHLKPMLKAQSVNA